MIHFPRSIHCLFFFLIFFLHNLQFRQQFTHSFQTAGIYYNKHLHSLQIENILSEMEQEYGLDVKPDFKSKWQGQSHLLKWSV